MRRLFTPSGCALVGLALLAGALLLPVARGSAPAGPGTAAIAPGGDVAIRRAASLTASSRGGARTPAPAPAAAPHWMWPTPGTQTGHFGEVRGPRRHGGIDIAGPRRTPISAAHAGTVLIAGPAPAGYGGYGNMVLADDGHGIQTLYAHLDIVAATVGQELRTGDLVGGLGNTGRSTGPHLHFEVKVDGVNVDPRIYLDPAGPFRQ